MDLEKAILCAKLSDLVYLEPGKSTDDEFKKLGFKFVEHIDDDSAQGYIVHDEKDIYVIYRGTELAEGELKDMLRNGMFWPTAGQKQGLVHAGFAEATDRVWDEVQEILDRETNKFQLDSNVTFAGHSQGGAMAVISAARSKYVADIYTFGAPRAGNAEYCRNIQSRSYRVTNGNDIIPVILPPIGYRHGGPEYKLFNNVIHKVQGFWDKFRFQFKIWCYKIRRLSFFRSLFSDHSIATYVEELGKAKPDNF